MGELRHLHKRGILKAKVDEVDEGGVKEKYVMEQKVALVTETTEAENGDSSPRFVFYKCTLFATVSSISTLLHPAEAAILQWSQIRALRCGVIVEVVVDSCPLETV